MENDKDIYSFGLLLQFLWGSPKANFGEVRPPIKDQLKKNLAEALLSNPANMTGEQVLKHPALWDNSKTMKFLMKVNNLFFNEQQIHLIENQKKIIFGAAGWKEKMISTLQKKIDEDENERRHFYKNTVRDLLRFIR